MMNLRTLIGSLLLLSTASAAFAWQDAQELPKDSRLSKYRNIYDKLHPWTPPTKLDKWKAERQRIRERILVSNGLWPLPEKTELKPKLGKAFERDGYTVQHAMFASRPGHYVTGLIYRPKNLKDKKVPGILCPHGHWADGRFYDAGDKKVKEQLDKKAEFLPEAARYPLQARFVQLARMGCVVFHYDMVGYADSTAIDHRKQFNDAEALLWLTNKMGLQTWNSIRSLDFISSLPEVDTKRLAVTGASGGGTQSFILAALDDRLAAAFPAVMVSTDMQGGCVCENASYLRIGINNAAIAACFAPKPMAMSGADDWTLNFMKTGLPEMRQVWSLYGKPTLVSANVWPEFKHNYNWYSRHMMYSWFNAHLNLEIDGTIRERGFKPLTREELSVWGSIDKPNDIKDANAIRMDLRREAKASFSAMQEDADKYREAIRVVTRVVFGTEIYKARGSVESRLVVPLEINGEKFTRVSPAMKLANGATRTPTVLISQRSDNRVLWVDDKTIDELIKDPVFEKLAKHSGLGTAGYFAHGMSTDELAKIRGPVDKNYAGLTYCYNLPLFAERVNDLVPLLRQLGSQKDQPTLVATGATGPMALCAAAAGDVHFARILIDLNGFSFTNASAADAEMMLPGALRYGDIGGLAASVHCDSMTLFGTKGIPAQALEPLKQMFKKTGAKLILHEESLDRAMLPELLK